MLMLIVFSLSNLLIDGVDVCGVSVDHGVVVEVRGQLEAIGSISLCGS